MGRWQSDRGNGDNMWDGGYACGGDNVVRDGNARIGDNVVGDGDAGGGDNVGRGVAVAVIDNVDCSIGATATPLRHSWCRDDGSRHPGGIHRATVIGRGIHRATVMVRGGRAFIAP
jgi:hypothetical protein